MGKSFEESLNDLINQYADVDKSEIISALELAKMAVEEAAQAELEDDSDRAGLTGVEG